MSASNSKGEEEVITYANLLRRHSNYRWFVASYIITQTGGWLTYVASLALVEHDRKSTRVGIAVLVVLRLFPSVLVAPFGGILADKYDRKINLVILDILGSVVALGYLLANRLHSVPLLYACTALQQMVAGLYEPSKSAIIPMLVSRSYLPKATTLNGILWSTLTALGAGLSGMIVQNLGIAACFQIDAMTYFLSALLLVHVSGAFVPGLSTEESDLQIPADTETETDSCLSQASLNVDDGRSVGSRRSVESNSGKSGTRKGLQLPSKDRNASFWKMINEALLFIRKSYFGPSIFIKGTGALLFGCADVITVVFAEDANTGRLDSARLGWMFASMGLGCFLGPFLLDQAFQSHCNIKGWLWASTSAFGFMGCGYIMIGFSENYWLKVMWNTFRAMGTSIMWIDSTLILQATTPDRLLGRIMAADMSLATAGEALSAIFGGILLDRKLVASADELALWLGAVGLIFAFAWLFITLSMLGGMDQSWKKDGKNLDVEMLSLQREGNDHTR